MLRLRNLVTATAIAAALAAIPILTQATPFAGLTTIH